MESGRVQFAVFDGSHAAHYRDKVFVSHVPRNAERVQDEALGGLAARHSFFYGVDGASRDARSSCELTLCPTKRLSCSADPVHFEPLRGVLRVTASLRILARSGSGCRGSNRSNRGSPGVTEVEYLFKKQILKRGWRQSLATDPAGAIRPHNAVVIICIIRICTCVQAGQRGVRGVGDGN